MNKYIVSPDGTVKLNPAYQALQHPQNLPPVVGPQPLAVISTPTDMVEMAQVTGQVVQLTKPTAEAFDKLQSDAYASKFNAPHLEGATVADGLTEIFSRYEIPIGLLGKLMALSEFNLNFILDNSGSMSQNSNVRIEEACTYMRQKYDPQGMRAKSKPFLSRWEEAEDRIHIMIELLAYVPSGQLTFSFLNGNESFTLVRQGYTPAQFIQMAHEKIHQAFKIAPYGSTPLLRKIQNAFQQYPMKTMHHIFSDGEPDEAKNLVANAIIHRRDPWSIPVVLQSCTNNPVETVWMKEVDEDAPCTAEIDNWRAEAKEVQDKQGPLFPFNRGFYILCSLVAPLHPDDLDAMDEPIPFSKKNMDELMGYRLSQTQYKEYFDSHPMVRQFRSKYDFNQFCREDITARQIIGAYQPSTSSLSHQPAYTHPAYQPHPPSTAPNYGENYITQQNQSPYMTQGHSFYQNPPPYNPQYQTPDRPSAQIPYQGSQGSYPGNSIRPQAQAPFYGANSGPRLFDQKANVAQNPDDRSHHPSCYSPQRYR